MKIIHKPLKYIILAIAVGLLPSLSANAASLDDVVKSLNAFQERAIGWLDSFKEMYVKQLYEENPSYPGTIAANSAVATADKAEDQAVKELTLPQIQEALTQKEEDQRTRILAAMPASDSVPAQSSSTISVFQSKEAPAASEGDSKFDLSTLIGPLSYSDDTEKQKAFDYIQFLTSIADPVSDINLSSLSPAKLEKLDNSAAGKIWKRYTRGLIASKSIALDNLYHLYAERVKVPDLGELAGMTTDQDKKNVDASPLQVQHYLATRRVDNPEWYNDMTKAAPPTVNREQLATMAEMTRQLYQLHQDNERIITLLSVITLQNIQTNKVLDRSKADAARRVLGS